jgi:hypothetical protein
MLLEARTTQMAATIQTLSDRLYRTEGALAEAKSQLGAMDDVVDSLRRQLKRSEALTARLGTMEEQLAGVTVEVERQDKRFLEHCERTSKELGALSNRAESLETTVRALPGSQVMVSPGGSADAMPLSVALDAMHAQLKSSETKQENLSKALRSQAEQLVLKADVSVGEDVNAMREIVDVMARRMAVGDDVDLRLMQSTQTDMSEQLDRLMEKMSNTIDKAYLDERVELKYEEIIAHLQKALSATEEDEDDIKRSTKSLQDLVEQLSASKADRRELIELKQYLTTLKGDGNGLGPAGLPGKRSLNSPVTRDELFNLLEEKCDRKELERRLAGILQQIQLSDGSLRRQGRGTAARRGGESQSLLGPEEDGPKEGLAPSSEPAERLQHLSDPDGAFAMSRQLIDALGRPVQMTGSAVGTCLSCKAPILHPERQELFPQLTKGGGFQVWSTNVKAPPHRQPPFDPLPDLDTAVDSEHVMGKDGVLYRASIQRSSSVEDFEAPHLMVPESEGRPCTAE